MTCLFACKVCNFPATETDYFSQGRRPPETNIIPPEIPKPPNTIRENCNGYQSKLDKSLSTYVI